MTRPRLSARSSAQAANGERHLPGKDAGQENQDPGDGWDGA